MIHLTKKDFFKSILITSMPAVFSFLPCWLSINNIGVFHSHPSVVIPHLFFISTGFFITPCLFIFIVSLIILHHRNQYVTETELKINLSKFEFELQKLGPFLNRDHQYFFDIAHPWSFGRKEGADAEIKIIDHHTKIKLKASLGLRKMINAQTNLNVTFSKESFITNN